MENERIVKSKDLRIGNFVYLFYDENDVLDFIREFERLINELESVVYDVTEISPYVERVLAGDEATCAELLAIYDRIDAEGAGA